tara:strand:+ start:18921 stop:19712 length:792 start_codon:yes stop_codon:yes gene_type:complete
LLKIFYIAAAIYLILLLLLFIFQRSMIYFPSPDAQRLISRHPEFSPIEIVSHDGLVIKSWKSIGYPDKKTFILFHGNAGNAADRMPMMRVLIAAGHSVILAEYRGYGSNPGKPNENDIMSDNKILVDKIIAGGVAEQDIIFMGRSLGSGIATQLATEYDTAALILISAYSSLPDVAGDIYPYFPVSLLMRDRFDSLSIISGVKAPIYMFHGERDQIIPIKFGRKLFEAALGDKRFRSIPLHGHNDLNMDHINSEILELLKKIS